MNTYEYMDKLDELLDDSFKVPLSSGKCVVDMVMLTELLNDMRESLPVELKQAEAIVRERNDIVAAARREADIITKNAEEKARLLVSQEEIILSAKQQANEMLDAARSQANNIMADAKKSAGEAITNANEYAAKHIRETQDEITKRRTEHEAKMRDEIRAAEEYVDLILTKTQEVLSSSLKDVKNTYTAVKSKRYS
ncbi:MAG: hypothetical protein Q8865_02700 [Bacillota bacterium]|nr:hypothetical protein [Bacillota bacterium]